MGLMGVVYSVGVVYIFMVYFLGWWDLGIGLGWE